MRSHIAFFNIPAAGHVYPTLAVVAELVKRGHRITYVTADDFAYLIEPTGATTVVYQSRPAASTDPHSRRAGHESLVVQHFLDEAEATLPQVEDEYACDTPDLVVHDSLAFAGTALAARYGAPSVQLWPILISGRHWSMLPPSLSTARSLRHFLKRWGPLVAPDRPGTTGGDPAHSSMDKPVKLFPRAERHLAFFPRVFQYGGDALDERYRFVGPCLGPRPFLTSWRPPGNDRPVLLATLGTLYNNRPGFFRLCVEAFASSPWHVVLTIGERTDPATVGAIPGHVEVHRTVSYRDVLSHASVCLSSGSMGGIMESLHEGVPLVMVPQSTEQELNATRVEELGGGIRLQSESLTAKALRDSVDLVAADETTARQVQEIKHEVRAAGGPSGAADFIEASLPIG